MRAVTGIATAAAVGTTVGGASGVLQTKQSNNGLTAAEWRGTGIATVAGIGAGIVSAYGFPAGPPYNGRAGWLVAALGVAGLTGGIVHSLAN